MIEVIVKGPQGSGKGAIVNAITELLEKNNKTHKVLCEGTAIKDGDVYDVIITETNGAI